MATNAYQICCIRCWDLWSSSRNLADKAFERHARFRDKGSIKLAEVVCFSNKVVIGNLFENIRVLSIEFNPLWRLASYGGCFVTPTGCAYTGGILKGEKPDDLSVQQGNLTRCYFRNRPYLQNGERNSAR